MKTKNFRFLLLPCAIIFISFLSLAKSYNTFNTTLKTIKETSISGVFLPDSTFEDTSHIATFGDTLEMYMDGADSIYIIASVADSTLRLVSEADIIIRMSDIEKNVVDENYGVSLGNFFKPDHAPVTNNTYYPTGENPWNLLADLGPQVVRYPGGSNSKFRHAFGSMNYETWNDSAGLKNGGYGICLEEILRFYDRTNEEMDLDDDPGLAEAIINDMNGGLDGGAPEKLDVVINWLAENQIADFEGFYMEWQDQPKYDPEAYENVWEEPLYLNELIDLVETVETANPG